MGLNKSLSLTCCRPHARSGANRRNNSSSPGSDHCRGTQNERNPPGGGPHWRVVDSRCRRSEFNPKYTRPVGGVASRVVTPDGSKSRSQRAAKAVIDTEDVAAVSDTLATNDCGRKSPELLSSRWATTDLPTSENKRNALLDSILLHYRNLLEVLAPSLSYLIRSKARAWLPLWTDSALRFLRRSGCVSGMPAEPLA